MSITNYTELQTAVNNWLHRSDLSSRIDEFIYLGEAYLNRKIRSPAMETSATVSTNTSDRYASFPAGARKIISLIDSNGNTLIKTSQSMVSAYAATEPQGKPVYYALTSRIEFDRVSDQVYSLTCNYAQKLDIATDTENWLLTNYPDCYLYASLLSAEPYMKNDARIATWKSMLDTAIYDANSSESENRPGLLRSDEALVKSQSFDINRGY